MRSTYAWHPEGSLAAVKHLAGSSTVADLATTYDVWGNRASGTETVNGSLTSSSYSYDSLNRLKTATINGSTETTAFDLFGNRSSKIAGGITTSYLYDAAQQLAEIQQNGVTAERLVYDDNGNLKKHCAGSASGTSADCTGSNVLTLAWNGLDQLIQANKTGQPVETYAYDDQGRRIIKVGAGGTAHYAYDGPDLLAEYAHPAQTPRAVYAHGAGIDEPLLRLTGSTTSPSATARYYAQDGVGSVIAAFGDIAEGGPVPATSVSATNSYSEGSYPSAKLIDGETTGSGGFWAGSSANLATTPATVTLELGGTRTVSRIALHRVTGYLADYIVKDAEVQIRNPDNSWTTVGTLSGNTTVDSPEITLTNATGSALKVLIKGVRSGNLVLLAEVTMQADGGAQAIATQRFDAWGKIVQSSGNIPQFGYTGREPDATGLIFYRARYYHPQAGRFVSRDPLGFAAGINPYAYAGGNPLRYNDPDGLMAQLAWNTGAQYWGQASDWVGNNAGLLTEIGVGFTPAGVVADVYSAVTGKTPLTGDPLAGWERAAVLIPGISELKGVGRVADAVGGAYKDVKGVAGNHAHHMPADSVSPIPRSDGPCISMCEIDHKMTASFGSSKEARTYREQQKSLIEQGRFREAQQMDIIDIQSKFGNKYDDAIQQMLDYTKYLGY